ncbi:MAG TPA: acetyl-CoA carboxylase biotin carboxyl carrier protein subunit [Acidobacteria bacterium]|nr:acetyl-CoA carboxylase biotin carboxyl carrier protein subunit [Acidobacteriota bacterium]
MELIVRHAEREERVQVRRIDEGYEVVLGGRSYRVDAVPVRDGVRSLRIDGEQHEVSVRRKGEDWSVVSRHGTTAVSVTDPLTHLANQTRGAKGGRRLQRVDAYMPGRVVALLVKEGDEVAAGQGVLVLEAMKMENEIRAEHEGKVTKIFVQAGQAVDTGEPLFELE